MTGPRSRQSLLVLVLAVALAVSVVPDTASGSSASRSSQAGEIDGLASNATADFAQHAGDTTAPVYEGAAPTGAAATGADSPTRPPAEGSGTAGPPPARRKSNERRAAFERVYANDTVAALRNGSFGVTPRYDVAAGRDVVTLKTWQQKRVEGTWRSDITVTYEEGYVARLAIAPESGAITEFALSERGPAVVTKNYSDAEAEAIEIALANESVADHLEDADSYLSMVRDEVTYEAASCELESRYLLVFKRTDSAARVTVHVSASGAGWSASWTTTGRDGRARSRM